MDGMFFDNSQTLLRMLIVGVLAYGSLITCLRLSGTRTLSKMNAFDFVVTIALGSTLATVLLNRQIALAEGVLAFALLIGLQFLVTWAGVRTRWVRRLVTGEPRMLAYRGVLLPQALRRARVNEDDIRSAVRSAGLRSLDEAEAVVLETDGSFSVVRRGASPAEPPSLAGVIRPADSRDPRCNVRTKQD